jgi:hypothetical protein
VRIVFRSAIAVLTIAMLLGCYAAAYFGTVTNCIPPLPGGGPWSLSPIYSVGGQDGGRAAEAFFYPIHALDRRARKNYWQLTEDEIWPELR